MKRITLRMIPLIVLLYSFQGKTNSSVVTNDKCSESFVGTVTEVLEVTPFSSNSIKSIKHQVVFKVDQLKNGPFASSKTFNVTKLKASQFVKGESYKVDLNDQLICHSEKIKIAMN